MMTPDDYNPAAAVRKRVVASLGGVDTGGAAPVAPVPAPAPVAPPIGPAMKPGEAPVAPGPAPMGPPSKPADALEGPFGPPAKPGDVFEGPSGPPSKPTDVLGENTLGGGPFEPPKVSQPVAPLAPAPFMPGYGASGGGYGAAGGQLGAAGLAPGVTFMPRPPDPLSPPPDGWTRPIYGGPPTTDARVRDVLKRRMARYRGPT